MKEELKKDIDNIIWWIPFKSLRNNIRHMLYIIMNNTENIMNNTENIMNNTENNSKGIELSIYVNNYLSDIDNEFINKLEKLIYNLDEDSKRTVFYFFNRIIKFYKYNDDNLKYMNEDEIKLLELMKEKEKLMLDLDEYQYYDGLKLTKRLNMSYTPNNFTMFNSYEVLFDKYLANINLLDKDILDVGACFGDVSIFLSRKTNKKVYAIEPVNETYNNLLDTIKLNSLTNIEAFNIGFSNYSGYSKIIIPTHDNSSFDLASASILNPIGYNEGRVENIKLMTMDDFVEKNNLNIGFIKVDIEGEEQNFLEGAKNTIIKQKPFMVISIYHSISDYLNIKPIIESYNLNYKFHIIKMMPYVGQYETILLCIP